MLKKRLLVLAVMLCSLTFVASEPAKAGSWCSCAATSCNECSAECDPDPGTTRGEVIAAAQSCCNQNWSEIGCGATVATSASGITQ